MENIHRKDYILKERIHVNEFVSSGQTPSTILTAKNAVHSWTNTTVSANGNHIEKRKSHKKWLFWIGFLVVFILAWIAVEPNVHWDKAGALWRGTRYMFDWKSPIHLEIVGDNHIWQTMSETVSIFYAGLWDSIKYSIIGSFIGMTLAIPFAMLATNRVTESKTINWISRAIVTFVRAIPIIMLTALIGGYFSYGSALPLIIMLSVFVWTLFTKWLYEDMDDIPQEQITAMRATGLTRSQIFISVVWPKVLRRTIASAFYMFEITFRFSAALSFVNPNFDGVSRVWRNINFESPEHYGHITVVVLLFVSVFVVNGFISRVTSKYLVNYRTRRIYMSKEESDLYENKSDSVRKAVPWLPKIIGWTVFVLLLAFAIWAIVDTSWALATPESIAQSNQDLRNLFRPDWSVASTWDNTNPFKQAIDSLGIIVLTFTFAILFAVPFGMLASRKITSKYIAWIFRLLIDIIRSISAVVFVELMFIVSPENRGAFAAVLGFSINSIGSLGRRMAMMINTLPNSKGKTMRTTGGSKYDSAMVSIAPDIIPGMISRSLYLLEINFKNLLMVGQMGISLFGARFNEVTTRSSESPANFNVAGVYLFIYIITSLFIEWLANWLRDLMEKPRKQRTIWSPFALKEKWLSFRISFNLWAMKWNPLWYDVEDREYVLKKNEHLFEDLSELRSLSVLYQEARVKKLAHKELIHKLKYYYNSKSKALGKLSEAKNKLKAVSKEYELTEEQRHIINDDIKNLENIIIAYDEFIVKTKENMNSIEKSFSKGTFNKVYIGGKHVK